MAQLFGLSAEQVDGIRLLFPKERGVKRVDDRKVFMSFRRVYAGWMPLLPMVPTKPSLVRQGCF